MLSIPGAYSLGGRQFQPQKQLLTVVEESVLAGHAIDLWKSGFLFNYNLIRLMVERMAGRKIGINWVYRFLTRYKELTAVRSRLLKLRRRKANNIEAMLD